MRSGLLRIHVFGNARGNGLLGAAATPALAVCQNLNVRFRGTHGTSARLNNVLTGHSFFMECAK